MIRIWDESCFMHLHFHMQISAEASAGPSMQQQSSSGTSPSKNKARHVTLSAESARGKDSSDKVRKTTQTQTINVSHDG